MKVVLLERVENLGAIGDVVTVKDGFARNFLLPREKALRATSKNLEKFELDRAAIEARNDKNKAEAQKIADKIDSQSYVMIRQAGETGQLYGSVAARDIAEAINAAGHKIERKHVAIQQPIKSIGMHDVTIRLHPEVALKVTLNVARSPDEAERQAKGEDVIAAGQAADKAADEEAAKEIAAAAQEAGFDRGPIDG